MKWPEATSHASPKSRRPSPGGFFTSKALLVVCLGLLTNGRNLAKFAWWFAFEKPRGRKMSEKPTPNDAILEFLKDFQGDTLDPAKDLLSKVTGMAPEQCDAASAAGADDTQLGEIHDLLAKAEQMQAMISDVAAAQEAGDWEKANEISKSVAELGGAPGYEPEQFEPPYDALVEAIENGGIDDIRAVLDAHKPDLNVAIGTYGMTPLLKVLGAEDRSAAKVQLLLDYGADATMTSSDGYGPLHAVGDYMWRHAYAPETDVAVAKLLAERGADLEARDGYGLTPLLRAINCGVPAEVAALLEAGADVNATSPNDALPACNAGQSALMSAVSSPEVVSILLLHGADLEARSATGQTVLEVIDKLLEDDAEESDYPQFYVDLRASRALIESRSRPI